MVGSALFLVILGAGATFFPEEIMIYLAGQAAGSEVLIMQITGALYLGFANLNWMVRSTPIGGIYGRPFALSNFLHFVMVSIVLFKSAASGETNTIVIVLTIMYTIFALGFGWTLFVRSGPAGNKKKPS